ncbi:MAG: putative adhesin [Polyangiales bacterium]
MFHRRSAVHDVSEGRRPVELGQHAFLWRGGRDVSQSRLMISSHGIYLPRPDFSEWRDGQDGWLNAPTSLVFYAPHGHSLLDPGTGPVMKGEVGAYETIPAGGRVRNYRLSKYQTRSAGETYEHVSYAAWFEETWDILTIRSRAWRFSITLREVLEMLRAEGYAYGSIHCVFCRSRLMFAESYDAKSNPPAGGS